MFILPHIRVNQSFFNHWKSGGHQKRSIIYTLNRSNLFYWNITPIDSLELTLDFQWKISFKIRKFIFWLPLPGALSSRRWAVGGAGVRLPRPTRPLPHGQAMRVDLERWKNLPTLSYTGLFIRKYNFELILIELLLRISNHWNGLSQIKPWAWR